MLCNLPTVQQAAVGDGLSFDPFHFDQNGLATSEIDVGGRQIADAFVIAQVTFSAIGPSSPAIRLTIARAARPVKTFVIAVWSSCAFFKACRYNGATFASGQNR